MKRLAGILMYVLVLALRPLGRVRRLVLRARIWLLFKRLERLDRVWDRLDERHVKLSLRLDKLK